MNSLTQNPIILEGTLASWKAGIAASLGTLTTLRVKGAYWLSPHAVGDQAQIIDPQNGRMLLPLRCEVAGQSQYITFEKPVTWKDFSIPKFDSGRLYIYTV